MAAKDYEFKSNSEGLYLAKRLKDANKISDDKRPVTEGEVLGIFCYFLKNYCIANNTDEMTVNLNGAPFFTAKLSPQPTAETPEENTEG